MKETLLTVLGIAAMAVLGYITAYRAQDLAWLLIPGLFILIALVALGKLLK